jgi:O-succinylbenzoic acid--CoA ligase
MSANRFFFREKYVHHIHELNKSLISHDIHDHYCIMSSGTTSITPKGYAFSLEALMNSAKAVHQILGLNSEDRWGLCLPPYHIAGLSIFVRSLLLKRKPAILYPWSPKNISSLIIKNDVTVISLVPTQVFDLVSLNIQAPKNIKIALVGGDFFSIELENRIKALGWPVVRTFGMTEVSSSLATGGNLNDGLEVLSNHEVRIDDSKKIWVKSSSLYTCQFLYDEAWKISFSNELFDKDGFYPLPDLATLGSNGIIPLGRDDNSFKSSGYLISLTEMSNKLDLFMLDHNCWGQMHFTTADDPRIGKYLTLIYEEQISFNILSELDLFLSPITIGRKIKVKAIKKTALGKKVLHD